MNFETLIFDLDDTLYPSTSGVWQAIGQRMDEFMTLTMGLPEENIGQLRQELFHEYGTTLRGLKIRYGIDERLFLDYVHDIPLNRFLQPDGNLACMLKCYNERKVIFTNASQDHAERVLDRLGLNGAFEQIIDVLQISPYCKPLEAAYEKAIEIAGISSIADCVIIDDSIRNLETAQAMGFFTIQVGSETRCPYADAAILSIYDLPDVLPVSNPLLVE